MFTHHTAELTVHPDGSHELKLSEPMAGHGGGMLPIQPRQESSMTMSGHRLIAKGGPFTCPFGGPGRCPASCPCAGRGPCRHRGKYFGYQ